jgi:site-specific DNA-cytosine methylase
MLDNKIKWGCIQPLTGGMYLGAQKAIGHPAEFIISYPGLCSYTLNKTCQIDKCGNEYHLLKYLEKKNELPQYKVFNKTPFDTNIDINNVELLSVDEFSTNDDISFNDIDIIVSVPVCSGLSQATIASDDTKQSKNCNMIFNTEYALGIIKPKIYIFENAPALFKSNSGASTRELLNNIASKYNYSIAYYKTNTKFHDNCQNRPRTFVIFFKNEDDIVGVPEMHYEHLQVSLLEYMGRMQNDDTQNYDIELDIISKYILKFFEHHYGEDFRQCTSSFSMDNIINQNLFNDIIEFFKSNNVEDSVTNKLETLFNHIQYKLSINKNYYCMLPKWTNKDDSQIPACLFKNIKSLIHYDENRLYNGREWLHLMGHPNDFELFGDIEKIYMQIGQNVPVRTSQWIVSEAVRIIQNWKTIDRKNEILYFDNTAVKNQR